MRVRTCLRLLGKSCLPRLLDTGIGGERLMTGSDPVVRRRSVALILAPILGASAPHRLSRRSAAMSSPASSSSSSYSGNIQILLGQAENVLRECVQVVNPRFVNTTRACHLALLLAGQVHPGDLPQSSRIHAGTPMSVENTARSGNPGV